jgi:photosystem II stability/assembly factor-like uncharacterized protein
MTTRRHLIGAAGIAWPLLQLVPLLARAAGLPDTLARPAAPMHLSSKPAMLRIVRAGNRLVAVGERGIVLLSDDEGAQWRQARVPVSVTLTGVQFVDAQRGWAIGHAAVVLHTLDGGESWSMQFDGRALPDGPANPLLDLLMLDEARGWAVGAYGLALTTHDGGHSWLPRSQGLPNPKGLHLYALARQGETLYIAGEQGLFLGTALEAGSNNSGNAAATALQTPYRGSFFAMAALEGGALLLGGLRGTLLLRQAGGEFSTLDSGTTQAIVSCALLAPQRQALVDQSGRVLLGSAAQGHFAALPLDAERRWVAVAAARDGTLVGAGSSGVGRLPASPTTTVSQ